MRGAKDLVAQKKLPVTFAGFLNQTEIVKAYLAADCLVLPSDYGETWGLVVNEAMACGLPAIVSDRVGCGPDLIIDGVTGYIFPFGDITALAGKLLECASPDKTKLIQMGVQAKALIANYSTENTVKGALEAVKYVLKARA
jgi:glycosyltransferase involved in cell wall biosynthesis